MLNTSAIQDGAIQARTSLQSRLANRRNDLLEHPLYGLVTDASSLRVFMESHVFAVWDFMALLKTLQQRLTCVSTPWLPSRDVLPARLMNEIVLGEETDEISPGRFTSHFELYVSAMTGVGADTAPILRFVEELRVGVSPADALQRVDIPSSTRAFVLHTLDTCRRSTPEVAASFLLGRETVIPDMFSRLLPSLPADASTDAFRTYLERHIHLDGEQHGPMGEQVLCCVCGTDPVAWRAAEQSAHAAIEARIRLWDGVVRELVAFDVDLSIEAPVR